VPKKIERLKALGLLAPSLLRKVVDMRNVLEHEYVTPEIGSVEEALDIASLFVMSASAMFIPFEDVLEFSHPESGGREGAVTHITAGLNRKAGRVYYTVYAYEPREYAGHCVGQCEIESGMKHSWRLNQVRKKGSELLLSFAPQAGCHWHG